VPARVSYDYAIVRVVPRVEREELVNVGVILFCRQRRFLEARVALDEARLLALAPWLTEAELAEIRAHLAAIALIGSDGPDAGPLGQLGQAERFHWLVAPRSTIVQPSPVHSGLTVDPAATLDHLLATMVRPPSTPDT
jgi:hypothetical protein